MSDLLDAPSYNDYAPNGLQVEGKEEVSKVAFAVSANEASISAAAEWGADMLVCHHGFFWKNEPRTLVGFRGERVRRLIKADMSLVAFHLPLDGHAELGNARYLLDELGAQDDGPFGSMKPPVGRMAYFPDPVSTSELSERIDESLNRPPLVLGPEREIQRLAIVTGSAASMITEAAEAGADAFLTGEPSEQSQGLALELGLSFYAAGHHATERGGLYRLMAWMREEFNLELCFIDIDNPV